MYSVESIRCFVYQIRLKVTGDVWSQKKKKEKKGLSVLFHSLGKWSQLFGLMVNSLHPNISMHILPTVLYTFRRVLSRRVCKREIRF